MGSDRKILTAGLLNLSFAAFELVGGLLTGSVAILSDALHDLGDAMGIGLSWLLEKKSKGQPDDIYTFGYGRYSVLGGFITLMILLLGSIMIIVSSVGRLLHPVDIHYDAMILFAAVGTAVNLCAAWFTRDGHSLNQRAVNLHLLEDVLGWLVVLIGAVIMRFTDFRALDPLLSIGVAVFILIHACKGLKQVAALFLGKIPDGISVSRIREELTALPEIEDAHHFHIWSCDGLHHYATVHIVSSHPPDKAKEAVRQIFAKWGVDHVTVELETPEEICTAHRCHVLDIPAHAGHCHGHHHHE